MPNEISADTRSVIDAIYAAWAARDVAGTLAGMADDCVYTMHVPTDVLAYGGTHRGKAAIGTCLQAILVDYSFVAYAVDRLVVDGESAHAQVIYYYRHTDSQHQMDGRFRHVWRVTDGRVTRIDEYHDVARLEAFLAMVHALIER